MPSTVPAHVVPHTSNGGYSTERDRVALARQLQVARYLDPWGSPHIVWCHSHTLVRGYKVIFNLYDIFPSSLNGCLAALGIGGAYHSGIEVDGTEYAFGGHPSDELGIMVLPRPLHALRKEAQEALAAGTDTDGSAVASLEWMPPLRSRTVLGWWMGPLSQLGVLLEQLQNEDLWMGSAYRLLSRNCNHFARAMCEAMLRCPHFKPAPGRSAPDKMVPPEVTRLTACAMSLGCCCACVVRRLNAAMPLAPHALQVFQGRGRVTGRGPAPWFREKLDSGCNPGGGNGGLGGASRPQARARKLGGNGESGWPGRQRRARAGSMLAAAAAAAAVVAEAEAVRKAAEAEPGAHAVNAMVPPQRQDMNRAAAPPAPPLAEQLELTVHGSSETASCGGAKPADGSDVAGGSSGSRRGSLSGGQRTPGHSMTSTGMRGYARVSTVTEADPETEERATDVETSPPPSVSRATIGGGGGGLRSGVPAFECQRPSLPPPPLSPLPDAAAAPSHTSPPPSHSSGKPHTHRRSSRRIFPDPRVDPSGAEAAEGTDAAGGSPHLLAPRPSWALANADHPANPGDVAATSNSGSAAAALSAAAAAGAAGRSSAGGSDCSGGQRLNSDLLRRHEEQEEPFRHRPPQQEPSLANAAAVARAPGGRAGLVQPHAPLATPGRLSPPAPAATTVGTAAEAPAAGTGWPAAPVEARDAAAAAVVETHIAHKDQGLHPQREQKSSQPHAQLKPQPQSPQPPGPPADTPQPWSVLSGGFVDLLFTRSPRPAPEPPPGVPGPNNGGDGGSASPPSTGVVINRRATHVGSSDPREDPGHTSIRSEPAAPKQRRATSGAGPAASELARTLPGGAPKAAPVLVPAPLPGDGLLPPAPPPPVDAALGRPSPPARYEILAAVQECVKSAGRFSLEEGASEQQHLQMALEQRRASTTHVPVHPPAGAARGAGAGAG